MKTKMTLSQALCNEYGQGYTAGIISLLDHIENAPYSLFPEGNYTGPLPDELRLWITRVRANIMEAANADA